MILKLSFLCLIFNYQLFAVTVLVTKEPLKYEQIIEKTKLEQKEIESVPRTCEPITFEDLENQDYVTTHHINSNVVICKKDVKSAEDTGVVFNFGGLKIVKNGKIIYENDEFIRFKNKDGTIEQIYKDGRLK